MAIKETEHGDVTLLTLSGKMMHGETSSEIHPYVKDLIEQGKKKVVVDMGKIKWFGSTGLGALLASYTSIKNADGELKIARPTRKISSVFYQMELNSVFDSYDSVEEAIESFE
jgi:anti-sigma B factor antagonist